MMAREFGPSYYPQEGVTDGVSIREKFAGDFLAAMLSNPELSNMTNYDIKTTVSCAISAADELIKQTKLITCNQTE